jgi:hypothetical protein
MTMDFFKMLQEGSKGPCMQLQMDSTDVANQIEKLFDSLLPESGTTNYIILKGKLMCMQGPEDSLKAVVKNLDLLKLTDVLVDSEVTHTGECPGSKEKHQAADEYVVPTCLQGSICFGFKPDQLTLNARDCAPLNATCFTDVLEEAGLANLRAATKDFAEAGLGNLSYIMPKDKSMCMQASNISYLNDVLKKPKKPFEKG